ncbi:hypothetical protein R3P38DRAFT_3023027, partial [Favolaschia claudopus]
TLFHIFVTIFLFSKSDVAPILGPTVPSCCYGSRWANRLLSFLMGFVWLELHLLTFEITGLEEDRLSNPTTATRAIVAGRIAVPAAQRLCICIGALSLAWSAFHGLLVCSAAVYIVAIVCYNECGLSRHWFLKSFLGSIGYVCYCWGTTVIFDHGHPLSNVSIAAIATSELLHTTTGHAQDFRDRFGDADRRAERC